MIVNPSINISIGDYGKKFITSFHNHFMNYELKFQNYATFYSINLNKSNLKISSIGNEDTFNNPEQQPLPGWNNRQELVELLKKDDNTYYIENSINKIYNYQINLIEELKRGVNFNIVNVNFIVSSFDENSTVLLNKLVSGFSKLYEDGEILSLSIKTFVVLTKDGNLLNRQEQLNTFHNLEEIKTIQSNFDSIFHNVIIIDEKNVSTVFLDINEESIGFVLNESITYLMTNHYKMIGNLQEAKYISLGLGTLFFDKKHFDSFFREKIIKDIIDREQLDEKRHLIDVTPYKTLRNNILIPFIQNRHTDFREFIEAIKKESDLTERKYSLLEYKFLFSYLLGKYNDVLLERPFSNREKMSLYDLLYKILSTLNPENAVDILELKKMQDKLPEFTKEINELEKDEMSEEENELLKKLKAQETELRRKINKDEKIIKETIEEYKAGIITIIEPRIEKKHQPSELQEQKENIFIRILNFFLSFFGKKEPPPSPPSKENIKSFTKSDADALFGLIESLEKSYKLLTGAIRVVWKTNKRYEDELRENSLKEYIFVKNITNDNILNNYFNNTDSLLNGLTNIYDDIIEIREITGINRFEDTLRQTINTNIYNIIDFNIVEYLNNRYNNKGLFISSKLPEIIDDMKIISKPFFNCTPGYNPNNLHQLMLFNSNCTISDKNDFIRNLSNEYPATLPSNIITPNNNKFSLINISILNSFDDIATYTACKMTYENSKDK